MQEGDGGGDRIAAIAAFDGARVSVLTAAAGVAKALAAAHPAHHRGREPQLEESRALLDVQLEVGADGARLEKRPARADRLGIEAVTPQRGLQCRAVVGAADRETG